MPRPDCARELEHVAMADEVRLHIGLRVLDAVADAGLRAEMDDAFESIGVGKPLKRFGVREIDAFEAEAVAVLAREIVEPRLLERRIVIIVEIVDADDVVAALQQGARRCRADEARGSCNENSHGRPIGGAAQS